MHADAKKRVVDAVDATTAAGMIPVQLVLHPDYARELALCATSVDLGSDAWAPSKERMIAELTHPDYDRNPARDDKGRPLNGDTAVAVATPQCQAHLKRSGVVLQIVLDSAMPTDKVRVNAQQLVPQEA